VPNRNVSSTALRVVVRTFHFLSVSDFENSNLNISFRVCTENRDSSVGIATGYGLDDRMIGVRFTAGAGNFSL
jgi:hypothetical protein